MITVRLQVVGTIVLVLITISTFAQVDWQKGGNDATPPGSQPIIGTDATWNAPLQFVTNGTERMRLYPSQTSTINGFTVDQTGYLLLSREPVLFNTLGPFSMLHLGGVQGSSKC